MLPVFLAVLLSAPEVFTVDAHVHVINRQFYHDAISRGVFSSVSDLARKLRRYIHALLGTRETVPLEVLRSHLPHSKFGQCPQSKVEKFIPLLNDFRNYFVRDALTPNTRRAIAPITARGCEFLKNIHPSARTAAGGKVQRG